jgi:Cu/Ag efflux pump CusA
MLAVTVAPGRQIIVLLSISAITRAERVSGCTSGLMKIIRPSPRLPLSLEYTRSLSRNGFSQITAVFSDKTDIYFARQQINERLNEAKANLPPGTETRMGPVSTGLGEIYMWTVHFKRSGEGMAVADGKPGNQSDGSYLTPEGVRLTNKLERMAYLRTVQDWIIRPQLRTVRGWRASTRSEGTGSSITSNPTRESSSG